MRSPRYPSAWLKPAVFRANSDKDPKVYAKRMRRRKEMGLTYFEMDLPTELVAERAGAVK